MHISVGKLAMNLMQIPTEAKIKFIDLLTSAGLRSVESTSFVSPKRVPQLADAAEVVQGIRRAEGVRYAVLVPNMKVLLISSLSTMLSPRKTVKCWKGWHPWVPALISAHLNSANN